MRRALLTVAAVVAGCGEADDGGAGEAPADEPITLSVGIDSVYAPMFLATAEDLFADEGIRVELRQFAQGGEGVDAMLAGEIDVAASADSTFLVRAARTDIAVLGPYVEDDGDYVKLVTREEITDPAQIEKIGVIPGQISEYGAAKLLEAEGIDAESVKVVKVAGPPEMPPLLQRGDIDAFVLNEPWPTRAQELGAKALMDASEFDLGSTLVLASTPAWVKEHRDEATALMRAMRPPPSAPSRTPRPPPRPLGRRRRWSRSRPSRRART